MYFRVKKTTTNNKITKQTKVAQEDCGSASLSVSEGQFVEKVVKCWGVCLGAGWV